MLTAEGGASLGETNIGGTNSSALPDPDPSPPNDGLPSPRPTVDNCRISGRRLERSPVPLAVRLRLPFQEDPASGARAAMWEAIGVIPAPSGLEKRNELGARLMWILFPDVRREDRPDEGLPNSSKDNAVIAVGGVDPRPLDRGTVEVVGEMPSSKYPVRGVRPVCKSTIVTSSSSDRSSSDFTARTSARNSSISRVIASLSSSIVWSDSTSSHLSNKRGQEGSSASS